jgi:hypothetical protein
LIGLLGCFGCLAIALYLVWGVVPGQESPGLQAVLAVCAAVAAALAGILAYLLYGYFTMSYALERQTLTVRWGRSRSIIPLEAIDYVGPAAQVLEGQRPGTSLPWPGYYLEVYPVFDDYTVRTFATQPLHRQVMVCAGPTLYALSPERPIRFMEELVRLRERIGQGSAEAEPAGPMARAGAIATTVADSTQQLPIVTPSRSRRRSTNGSGAAGPATAARRPSAPPALFNDQLARQMLLGGLLLTISMVVFIFIKLPGLPDSIPLHFNALGQVDRIGRPGEILWLPGLTLLVAISNLVLALSIQRYDVFAARLLLAGPLLTGLVAWVAVINLI